VLNDALLVALCRIWGFRYDRKDKSDGMLGRCMLDTYGIELNETHEHVLNLGVDEPNEDGTIRIAVTVQQV